MTKRIVAVMLVLAMAFTLSLAIAAADDITVIINGVNVKFDVPPRIINDRTMVPMRKCFESLGAKVDWVADMRLALATYKTFIIAMPLDSPSFTVTDVISGETKEYPLDVPAQIFGDRTLIPLRALSEALGKTVSWDGPTRTATIVG